MISPALRDAIRADLDRWEGYFAWMYLDSVGLVTVGYGTMIPDATTAQKIPFLIPTPLINAGPASAAAIKAAFDTLQSGSATQKAAVAKQKFGAKHYEKVTDLRITQETASRLRDTHVDADYVQLQQIYKQFDTFPDNAKIALFDMIYNLGAGHGKAAHHRASGLRAYAGMNAAIAKGDWATAAQNCSRHGIPVERNTSTASLFKSCVPPKTLGPKAPGAKLPTLQSALPKRVVLP